MDFWPAGLTKSLNCLTVQVSCDMFIVHIMNNLICYCSEHHTKVNISWNDNNTVTFQQVRRWHFVPERSNGTLRDEVTNINVIAVVSNSLVHFK
jgi:hypothetical protein